MRDHLEKLIAELAAGGIFLEDAIAELEKKYIQKVLQTNKGNQSIAAKALGIHRNTLGRKVVQYHLASKNGAGRSQSRRTKSHRPLRGGNRQA